MVFIYVYSMTPSLYWAGRALQGIISRKRRELRELFGHLLYYLSMLMGKAHLAVEKSTIFHRENKTY